MVENIPKLAFSGCLKLNKITIPASVRFIIEKSFSGCQSVEYIFIPSSDINVCDDSFEFCESLELICITSQYTIKGIGSQTKVLINNDESNVLYKYGNVLYYGDGVSVNKEKAYKYYRMAIDLGGSYTMYNYGRLLDKGDEVPINKEEAIKYYRMAADKKNQSAINKLKTMNLL